MKTILILFFAISLMSCSKESAKPTQPTIAHVEGYTSFKFNNVPVKVDNASFELTKDGDTYFMSLKGSGDNNKQLTRLRFTMPSNKVQIGVYQTLGSASNEFDYDKQFATNSYDHYSAWNGSDRTNVALSISTYEEKNGVTRFEGTFAGTVINRYYPTSPVNTISDGKFNAVVY